MLWTVNFEPLKPNNSPRPCDHVDLLEVGAPAVPVENFELPSIHGFRPILFCINTAIKS